MKIHRLFSISLILTALALGRAGAADTPNVDSILAKYVTELGGKAAIEKVKSRALKIKIEAEGMEASEGEILAKAPNKQWSQIELAGMGTMNEGFDGTVAWAKTPWEGLRVKAGDELAKVKRDAEFHRDLNLKTLYPGLAYKGTEKAGTEEAYALECKPSATSKEKLFFSPKTGLLIRQESEFETAQGPVGVVVDVLEYRTFEALKIPGRMKIKVTAGGQPFEFTMRIVEVKLNVTIDDAKFAKPAA